MRDRPPRWEKRVSAAYLRIIGLNQKQAAKSVGVTRRTIQNWEAHETWPQAKAEARDRWCAEIHCRARGAILKALEQSDATSARWVLERMDPDFAPPRQRHELGGMPGNPIRVDDGGRKAVAQLMGDPESFDLVQQLRERMNANGEAEADEP